MFERTVLLTGLKDVLKTFDEHGWKGSFKRELWEISNGGYDCWFELTYKGLVAARCIDGKLESNVPWFNDAEKEKIFNKILEVYDHLEVKRPSFNELVQAAENKAVNQSSNPNTPNRETEPER